MTPTATTPDARRSKPKSSRQATPASGSPRTAGHRGDLRRQPAPRAPRRVSGPSHGVRGSAGGRARPAVRGPLPARAAAFVRALPDHPLLDSMVRGRAWIPLLGVLLAGIVAMQVEVLKLSATMGRSLERGTALQSRNDQLRASVASLSDAQRIERLAVAQGMVMPAPTSITFLSQHANGGIAQAAARIHAPDASAFMASLPVSNMTAAASAGSTAAGSTTTVAVSPGAGSTSTASVVPATGSATPASAPGAGTGSGTTAATGSGTPMAASGTPGAGSGVPGSASGTPPASAGGTVPVVAPAAAAGPGVSGQQPSSTGAAAVASGG